MVTRALFVGTLVLTRILLGTASASSNEQTVGSASSDNAELTRLEQVWNESHLRGDADALAKLWDDDLSVIVPKMRSFTKQDALGMLRSGRFKFTRYETSDLSIRVYGDTAIVTGRLQRTRKMGENEIQDDWHFSKVYFRHGKEWRVVLWQASEEPAQEPKKGS